MKFPILFLGFMHKHFYHIWKKKKKKKKKRRTYHRTFSGLAMIKLFLKIEIFYRDYLFEMPNFKKMWKIYKIFLFQTSPPLKSKYPMIDDISLSYNLMEHYLSPILQKEAISKLLIMLKIKSFKNFQKKLLIFIAIFL